ncbi:TetR/AcrR family transcriptional regulator [Streptomyces sp. Go40/10]|uniref:TetR/AcrR family transcriptional regulator n=1 Tax=Streptomyces sp. Go40/10 TaxID=2825844 RepID=UPI001E2D03C5|nr:TetR family transcriptional regulator [Streptomyces sp. Go40/10]UFR07464.1 TetR/AcrR family transcriptional regulator [Streptomyces sp. Go40/10]
MEIARAAAALFVRQGLRATRAEDIAQAAGIAPRTFYRYFATKEEAVAPLYAAGAQRWTEAVRTAPAHLSLPQALEHAVQHTLTPGIGVSATSWEWLRTLVRLADTSPALRKVWAEVCQASEGALAEILLERVGTGAREAVGGWKAAGGRKTKGDTGVSGGPGVSGGHSPSGSPGASEGHDPSGGVGGSEGHDPSGGVGGSEGPESADAQLVQPGPDLRFAAAVAGAAVRVAVESWAATATPPTGPGSPAALALRNLRALRDFEWGGSGRERERES